MGTTTDKLGLKSGCKIHGYYEICYGDGERRIGIKE